MNRICFNRGKNICLGYVAALLLCMLVSGCDKMEAQEYIPQAPDYSDSTFWYTEENDKTGKNADVFYIVSTWEKTGRTRMEQRFIMRMFTTRSIGMT